MRIMGVKARRFTIIGLALLPLAGCAEMGVYNPFRRSEWAEERAFGPNQYDRIADLRTTARGAANMPAAEQEQAIAKLAQQAQQESNPLMRAQIVRTLGAFSAPGAIAPLQQAQADKDTGVRIAACDAWAQRGGAEAVAAMAQVMSSDTESDVRMAAARSLGELKDPAGVPALALALDDTNPALQHRAIESLRMVSGKDYGGDVAAWREYAKGRNPKPFTPPSVAERVRNLF